MKAAALRDRIDGLANPLLIKEMYQALHNRAFLAALWLMLGGSVFVYILVYEGSRDNQRCGEYMFTAFAWILYFAGMVVVPYLAYSNLGEEVKTGTIELIHITRMTAGKHVRGRWLALAVRVALVFAVMGPFAVAAFLFKGIDVIAILAAAYVLAVLSLLTGTVAIFFAATTSVPQLRTIMRIGFLLFLFQTAFVLPGWVVDGHVVRGFSGVDLSNVLIPVGVLSLFAFFAIWFTGTAAANVLTFEADKSSDRTKKIFLGWCVAFTALMLALRLIAGGGYSGEDVYIYLTVFQVPLAVFGSFWITGQYRVAQRIRKELERRKSGLRTLLTFTFIDGSGSTAGYLLICTIVAAAGTLVMSWGMRYVENFLPALFTPLIYLLFFSVIARAIARILPGKWRTPFAARGVFLVLIAVNMLLPLVLITAWEGMGIRYSTLGFFKGLSPMLYSYGASRAGNNSLLSHLIALAVPIVVGCSYHVAVSAIQFRRLRRGEYS